MWRTRFLLPLSAGLATLFLGVLAGRPALASGPVVGWGSDSYGKATPPPSVDGTAGTATAIAAGNDHSCAIQAETGAVVCWGAECTGTLDAEGKSQGPDKRDSIKMKQDKKTQLWSIAVKRKKNDFAADLWDEGCTNADNPEPGMPVTVPLIVTVEGVAYGQDVDLVYKSKQGKKGIAK